MKICWSQLASRKQVNNQPKSKVGKNYIYKAHIVFFPLTVLDGPDESGPKENDLKTEQKGDVRGFN